ncbi:Lysophospholipase L1 [Belliella buryatensis]|uniref:Lysophospholipase L1 n=1 Tax=Belliella buryatensis TaxID=1500549 RepID=A0A239F4A3_9BACT|nr:SGNH/GDSL hydrolase family protein [Belliella buryatensis]SNS51338.1 Lysophospholipase L1 [Belliella buryatensis]
MRLTAYSDFLSFTNSNATQNLLIIGESTAAGVGASDQNQTFAAHTFNLLQRDYHIYNIGKNGLKANALNLLFQNNAHKLPKQFDKAVILIGANDCFQFSSPQKFSKGLDQCINHLHVIGCQLIIIPLIPPVHQFPAIPTILQFFLGIHRQVLIHQMMYIASRNKSVVYIHQNEQYASDFFAKDGIHPSDLGYQKMSEIVAATIIKTKEKDSQT